MYNLSFGELDENRMFISVRAGFVEKISHSDIPIVLDLIARLTQDVNTKGVLLVGLKSVKIDEEAIEIDFVFSTDTSQYPDLKQQDVDFGPKMQVNYVLHVFASIDKQFTLQDQPFPPGFRNHATSS
jgi:hypothetical protein